MYELYTHYRGGWELNRTFDNEDDAVAAAIDLKTHGKYPALYVVEDATQRIVYKHDDRSQKEDSFSMKKSLNEGAASNIKETPTAKSKPQKQAKKKKAPKKDTAKEDTKTVKSPSQSRLAPFLEKAKNKIRKPMSSQFGAALKDAATSKSHAAKAKVASAHIKPPPLVATAKVLIIGTAVAIGLLAASVVSVSESGGVGAGRQLDGVVEEDACGANGAT